MATWHGGWGGAAAGAVIGISSSRRSSAPRSLALPSEVSAATYRAVFPVLMSRSSASSSTMARPPFWSSREHPRADARQGRAEAEKHIAKQFDVSTADVDAAVKAAAGQVGWSRRATTKSLPQRPEAPEVRDDAVGVEPHDGDGPRS
jgi:hypothetical protein